MIRVFLADDHPLLRLGLRFCFEKDKELELVGEASDGFSAIERILSNPPNVALIDVDMPGLSGIATIRLLRKAHPFMKILVLSTYNDEAYINEAMLAGANGYILKNVDTNELLRIIKTLVNDEHVISPYLVNLCAISIDPQNNMDSQSALSAREMEIARHLYEGDTNKDIANRLNISPETVKTHIKNIYRKLGVRNRIEATKVFRKMYNSNRIGDDHAHKKIPASR